VLQVQDKVGTNGAFVCCCAHGRRGGDAAKQLAEAGVQQVVNLAGGMAAWSDAKLPHEGQIKRHH
jgi:rhodanese-related sulfurtransferase